MYLESLLDVIVALSFEGMAGVLCRELVNQRRGASEAQDLGRGKFRLPVQWRGKIYS